MSQQNPGQPGGYGGGYGAGVPGPGGMYGGPPGAGVPGAPNPSGGYPYPGQVPGYPGNVSQPAPGGGANKNKLMLFAGIGCALVVVLGIGAAIGAFFWMRNRANAVAEEVTRQVEAGQAAGSSVANAAAQSADCAAAFACCTLVAEKSTGNKEAVKACDVLKLAGYPQQECRNSLNGYRTVAKAIGVTCAE